VYQQVLHSKILHGEHIPFVCSAWISEQVVTFSLYDIKRYVLYNQDGEVYCAVRSESLYKTDTFHVIYTVHSL